MLDINIKKIKLKRDPIIIEIIGFINNTIAIEFAEKIALAQTTGQPIIPIYIHSSGGETFSFIYILNHIRTSKIPIATIISSYAEGWAACLFTCAPLELRFMLPNAKILLHNINYNRIENINKESNEEMNNLILEKMAFNCNKSIDFFKNIIKEANNAIVFIDDKQAKLLDIIIDSKYPILKAKINIEYSFETLDSEKVNIPNSIEHEKWLKNQWKDTTSFIKNKKSSIQKQPSVIKKENVIYKPYFKKITNKQIEKDKNIIDIGSNYDEKEEEEKEEEKQYSDSDQTNSDLEKNNQSEEEEEEEEIIDEDERDEDDSSDYELNTTKSLYISSTNKRKKNIVKKSIPLTKNKKQIICKKKNIKL